MDSNAIRSVCDEEFVTDAMIEEVLHPPSECPSFTDTECTVTVATRGNAVRGHYPLIPAAACTSWSGVDPLSNIKNGNDDGSNQMHAGGSVESIVHCGGALLGNSPFELVDVSHSEITSDESGDFAFLTDGVHDADAYDLIRDYILYCKQQEKELEELEEECGRLEVEQQRLYGAAIAADMTRTASHTFAAPSRSPMNANEMATTDTDGVVSPAAVDEFNEAHIDLLKMCPYMNPYAVCEKLQPYFHGKPAINGYYTPVFKNGILYCCVAADGSWIFYNDSEQYRMDVKYIVSASSVITAGPNASVQQMASGEYGVQVTVWPQETEVLLVGQVNGFKNLCTAVPVNSDYTNPHAEASTASAQALLNRFAQQSGKSSVSLLTTEDVLKCCGAQGSKLAPAAECSDADHFVDPEFPPCNTSLYRKGVDDIFLWDMSWRRPRDYLPPAQRSEACLFAGALLPTDPCMGDFGDVYLCNAACVLAEHPTQVYRLFRHPISADAGSRERAVGAYRVTLNNSGWWTTTVVDSYFPASHKGPSLARCSYDQRKLWYPLLEKAYAKLHGSYAAIQCGNPLETLQDLTGYPTLHFYDEWAEVVQSSSSEGNPYNPQSEHLFTFLEEKLHGRGYIVCLSMPDEGPEEGPAVQMGMEYGMSYAVLRLVRHGNARLLQIRVPTVTLGRTGLWSAGSARWKQEPELARLCGMDGDGEPELATLWLDWSEALSMFEGGGVCCTRWEWAHDCRVRGFFNKGVPSFVLEVTVDDSVESANPVEAYCILSQEDDRSVDAENPTGSLCPLSISVSIHEDINEESEKASKTSEADQRIRYVCSADPDTPLKNLTYILARDTALQVTLQPSKHPYYVIPRTRTDSENKLFTVGFVSSTPVTKTGRLRIRMVRLPANSSVFRNRRGFSTKELQSVEDVQFQIRGPDGRVRAGSGGSIG
ncbi:calpain-like cysteine peptidase, putative [Leishmania tarentolae]|uniref:Calpain-like cysteine peptidase, putative n=1 Tax=Leishmania tarentolae TaxID=5689 RepID=A0A640KPS1_LEITA|nr:calpain-like cysteine peptidase, putative [Leishmania tarentolae]